MSAESRIVLAHDANLLERYERRGLHVSYDAMDLLELSLLLRNVTDETCIEGPHSAYPYGHFFGAPRPVLLRAQ